MSNVIDIKGKDLFLKVNLDTGLLVYLFPPEVKDGILAEFQREASVFGTKRAFVRFITMDAETVAQRTQQTGFMGVLLGCSPAFWKYLAALIKNKPQIAGEELAQPARLAAYAVAWLNDTTEQPPSVLDAKYQPDDVSAARRQGGGANLEEDPAVKQLKRMAEQQQKQLDTLAAQVERVYRVISGDVAAMEVTVSRAAGDEDNEDKDGDKANQPADPLAGIQDGASIKKTLDSKVRDPRVGFEKVILPEEIKTNLLRVVQQEKYRETIFGSETGQWGLSETIEKGAGMVVLLYGGPGCGKTMVAEAIAKRMGKQFWLLSTGEFNSMYVGVAEKKMDYVFQQAKAKDLVLCIDECDSLVSARAGSAGNQTGYYSPIEAAQTEKLLGLIEEYPGVLIMTTNITPVLDEALESRVSLIQEIPFPSEEAREAIWRGLIPERAPITPDVDIKALAKHELAGRHIKNAVLNAFRAAGSDVTNLDPATQQPKQITAEHFAEGVRMVYQGRTAFGAGAVDPRSKVKLSAMMLERAMTGMDKSWLQ